MSGAGQSDEEWGTPDSYTVRTKNTFLEFALPPDGDSDDEFMVPQRRQVSAPASCSGSASRRDDESRELPSCSEILSTDYIQERPSDATSAPDGSPSAQDDDDEEFEDPFGGDFRPAGTPNSQAEGSDRGRRRRPNKSKRVKFNAFARKVEEIIRQDPENFSWEHLDIPPAIGVDNIYTPKLRASLERLAFEMSADARQTSTGSSGGASSSFDSSNRTASAEAFGGSRQEGGHGGAEEARQPESFQALDPIKDESLSSGSSKQSSPTSRLKMSL